MQPSITCRNESRVAARVRISTAFLPRDSVAPLADRFDFERSLCKGLQQVGLALREMNPRCPILRPQHDDLTFVIRRDVGSGLCRQHRERRRMIALTLAPQAGDRSDR